MELVEKSLLSHVTDWKLGKANADHHYRGWCMFERLVKSGTCENLLQEAKAASYITIFNRLGKHNLKKDARMAAKAGVLGEQVIGDILAILRRGLIIGEDHVDGMGRGSSYLQTPPGCVKQSEHLDFDFVGLAHPGRRCVLIVHPGPRGHKKFEKNKIITTSSIKTHCRGKPVSIWVALERSSLYLDGTKHAFNAGDVVVFSGDCKHGGAEADSVEQPNYRLFAYVPTKTIPVPWELKTGMEAAAKAAEVCDVKEIKELHNRTLPKSDSFDLNLFRNNLYDFRRNKFYRFSTELWLGGLTTNTSDQCRYRP
jgi:hypothetical protein